MKSTIRFILKRLRTSTRVLMGLILIFGVVLARFANDASEQRKAVAAVEQAGGEVWYEEESHGLQMNPDTGHLELPTPRGPLWLRQILGRDFFDNVVVVKIRGIKGDGTDVGMDEARAANLISHLHRFPQLKRVWLSYANISPASFERLCGLDNVEDLCLFQVPMTDADLRQVARMKSLKSLNCYGCNRISDAGIKHLKNLTKLESLDLTLIKLTDACVEDLVAIKSLKSVALWSPFMSAQGLADLKATVPTVDASIAPWP